MAIDFNHPIDVVEDIDLRAFEKNYLHPQKPVILRGLLKGTKAYEEWDFNSTYDYGPDRYEWNDDMDHAYPLMVNTNYTGMYMRNGELDWYKVNLTEGNAYHIDM